MHYAPSIRSNGKTTLTAYVDFAGDDKASNNRSSSSVKVEKNDYPVVNDLSATDNGELQWSAPTVGKNAVTDDIESYHSFTIDGIGDWKVVDGDGKPSYTLQNIYFEHNQEPYAFIVFNPAEAGVDVNDNAYKGLKAHSGSQYLACFDAANSQNDDWLISPSLSGNAQTITFYAKNVGTTTANKYVDEFEVLYSTGGTETKDFEKVTAQPVKATDEWTEYSFNLPKGATNFAIHVVSKDQFALFLDDISYEGADLVINGYNIYCDGEKIATVDANSKSYSSADADAGSYKYYVTVIYNAGESGLSNEASATTGIKQITTAHPVDVYTTSGIKVRSKATSLEGLHPGVYIINGKKVTVNGK